VKREVKLVFLVTAVASSH